MNRIVAAEVTRRTNFSSRGIDPPPHVGGYGVRAFEARSCGRGGTLPYHLGRIFHASWGAHAPSRVPVGALPTGCGGRIHDSVLQR